MEDTFLRNLLLAVDNHTSADTGSVTSKATSAYTINPTNHGQQRMTQRNVSKKELQEARKYGRKENSKTSRYIYRYNGLVYITDSTSTKVITCYRDTSAPTLEYVIKHGQHDVLNKGFNHRYILDNTVYITDTNSKKILEKYKAVDDDQITSREKNRRNRYYEKKHGRNNKASLTAIKEQTDVHIDRNHRNQCAPYLNKKGGLVQNYSQNCGFH